MSQYDDLAPELFSPEFMHGSHEEEQALFQGEPVEILEVESDFLGSYATIRFNDGREDTVPLNALSF
jgi:hypothetical protein